MLQDYDIYLILYDEVNVVVDSFSRNTMSIGNLALLEVCELLWVMDIHSLANSFARLHILKRGKVLSYIEVRSYLFVSDLKV